jgi:nucleoside 2-deoxyribosyltransferase
MIYLASPYSHPDAAVREQRFRSACQAAARLMRNGEVVFSPIAHGHPIALHGLPTDWRFWERHDREQLNRCDEVVVLTLDGWRESEGVQAEIRIAGELGKPVRYLMPDGGDTAATLAHVAKEAGS